MDIPAIILIDKPKGITSFDVIRALRKKLNIKKMGHAGTLDPLATGLMIIGIQKGTKMLEEYLKLPKVYYAEILLGKKSDTGDREGAILEKKRVTTKFSDRDIEDALDRIVGAHTYPVPMYSAIKVDGRPLYWYARNNEVPSRIPEKEMEVRAISLLDSYPSGEYWMIKVRIDVSSGTYIRVLAEKIGEYLGYPALLYNLRRTKIGDFDISDAHILDEI